MPYTGQQMPYPDQPRPYAGQPMSHPGQPNPYAGQPMPHLGQPNPYAGQPMPQPGQPMPHPGQPMPSAGQQTVIVYGNPCPTCKAGALEYDYTGCGICLAICCFPFGFLCCWLMKKKVCGNPACRAEF